MGSRSLCRTPAGEIDEIERDRSVEDVLSPPKISFIKSPGDANLGTTLQSDSK